MSPALIVTSFSQRFAYRSVRRYHPSWRQPLPEERLLGILASGQTGYELGTAVGLAAAGDEGAGDHLEVWALERESEPQVRALVERVRSMILLPESPAVLASELAWLHAGLGAPA